MQFATFSVMLSVTMIKQVWHFARLSALAKSLVNLLAVRKLAIIAMVVMAGCSTTHRPPTQDISGLYIDCTNRVAFERLLDRQLALTDRDNVGNPTERAYYAAIKDRLWTLRSTCR